MNKTVLNRTELNMVCLRPCSSDFESFCVFFIVSYHLPPHTVSIPVFHSIKHQASSLSVLNKCLLAAWCCHHPFMNRMLIVVHNFLDFYTKSSLANLCKRFNSVLLFPTPTELELFMRRIGKNTCSCNCRQTEKRKWPTSKRNRLVEAEAAVKSTNKEPKEQAASERAV